ncbi:hypothetical protein D621_01690 [beta proteobacterium AAP51]|nr:hypothetical protein D621_01690 [beta proteobacterium AAP51]
MRGLKLVLWSLGGLLALALAVAAAWVDSNWNDAEPAPLPERLRLAAAQLPPDENAFFALQGLLAAPGEDPVAAGRASWQAQLAQQARSHAERQADAERLKTQAPPQQTTTAPASSPLTVPSREPWACGSFGADCPTRQLADAERLAEQQAAAAAWGERCDRIADAGQAYEEPVPESPNPWQAMPLMQSLTACGQWFAADAVLAFAAGDLDATFTALQRGALFGQRVQAGSHSLIGQMVALRVQQRHLHTLAALAVRNPALAQAVLPLLAPAPALLPLAQRALVYEAAFGRGALQEAAASCEQWAGGLDETPAEAPWPERLRSRAEQAGCEGRIGFHLQRTLQVAEARWLHMLDALGQGWQPGIAAAQRRHEDGLYWRNTVGMMLLDVGSGSWGPYVARFADAELLQQAVVLVVQGSAQGVAASERAAWLAQQKVPAPHGPRLALRADGLVLQGHNWQADVGEHSFSQEREAIVLAWPL